jgi:hypothetical protein
MIYRIELYIDNPERASFLREVEGDFKPGAQDNFVVVGREYGGDETNRVVTRTWFLSTSQPSCDGEAPPKAPKHKIVSTAIHPGEPTPPADPTAVGSGGFNQEVLTRMKQSQIRQSKELEHHERFCKTYTDAKQRAIDVQTAFDRLETELAAQRLAHSIELQNRDDEIRELKNDSALNRQQIATLQASYSALENRKSLKERVKVWCRSTLKHFRSRK